MTFAYNILFPCWMVLCSIEAVGCTPFKDYETFNFKHLKNPIKPILLYTPSIQWNKESQGMYVKSDNDVF